MSAVSVTVDPALDPQAATPGLASGPGRDRLLTVLAPLAAGAIGLGLWEFGVRGFGIDPYVLPTPSNIGGRVIENLDTITAAMTVTGRNALLGLVIGAVLGILTAIAASVSRLLDEMALPIVAALSVLPIVALAPVLYTMFGAAVDTARIIVAALAVVIPVHLNTLRGLRQVKPVHLDLLRASAASTVQVVRTVTLPTATPHVFTGLRIGSSMAVISALIAEYFGGPIGGLGKSITSAAASSNFPLAWAYVVGAIALGLAFFLVTLALETWFARDSH